MKGKHKFAVAMFAATLAGSTGTGALAAEIWSQPVYTEVWSEPVYTENWSQNWELPSPSVPAQEAPAAPAGPTESPTGAGNEPSVYLKLQLDNRNAQIGNRTEQMNVAPVTINGRTMVPFRFLAEAIGAEVKWDQQERKITMTLGGQIAVLWLDNPVAEVNGMKKQLDSPPVLKNGNTLVPLRFIGESLDMNVAYDAATKTIEVYSKDGTPPPANPGAAGQTAGQTAGQAGRDNGSLDDFLTDFEALYGNWKIWIPSTVTDWYWSDTGNYATHTLTPGAEAGTVSINKDGTYAMNHGTLGKADGKWRLSYPREINGEVVQGIILQNGPGKSDWAVAPSSTGKIRLLQNIGEWADGSTMWLFVAELY
jgi:hypothetical protein